MKKTKYFTSLVVFSLISVLTVQSVFAGNLIDNIKSFIFGGNEQNVTVELDGKAIDFPDTKPYVNEDSRTMVPVRFVTEALGCNVKWEEANQMVIISKGQTRILLQIGQNWAIVNDTKTDTRKEFDTAAVMKDDRTMVPLRFVSETLGAKVGWDESKNLVSITSGGAADPVATPSPAATPAPANTPAPTATISPADYTSKYDKLKGTDIEDPTAKSIYDLGYYVFSSVSFSDGGYGISFTDKPDGKEVFGVSVSQYNISIDLDVVTSLSKEMLYKTLQILYPENYEEYYNFYMKRIDNREAGNRFENMNGLTFHTNLMTVPYYSLYSNIYPSNN